MANELTKKEQDLVSVLETHDPASLLRPLVREIHLFDSYIAGTAHLADQSVLNGLKAGDTLTLRREESRFDPNTVLILRQDGEKLGYVPEKDELIFARLMDAGKLLKASVTGTEQIGSFRRIAIGIFLVDF